MTALFRTAWGDLRRGDRPLVAVLPFTDANNDPEQRFFSDDVTKDIIVELSRFREILVIAPSSFSCEAFAGDVGRVAQELGVRYVLEGGIRRAPDRLRLTAQLIDAIGGDRIWTDRYDQVLDDVLEMQSQLATRIVGSLVPELDHAEQHRAERLTVDNAQAYEMALKAGSAIQHGTLTSDASVIRAAVRLAEDAVELDPLCRRAFYAIALGCCRLRSRLAGRTYFAVPALADRYRRARAWQWVRRCRAGSRTCVPAFRRSARPRPPPRSPRWC